MSALEIIYYINGNAWVKIATCRYKQVKSLHQRRLFFVTVKSSTEIRALHNYTFYSSLNVSTAGEVKSDDELDVESENSAEEMNSPGATGGVFVHTAAVEENGFFFIDR